MVVKDKGVGKLTSCQTEYGGRLRFASISITKLIGDG